MSLTVKEERLLYVLMIRRGKYTSYGEIIEEMWPVVDMQPLSVENCVKTYVGRLRRRGLQIENRWGRGYELV